MTIKLHDASDEELKKMDSLVEELKMLWGDMKEFLNRNNLTDEEEYEKYEIEETMEKTLEELFKILKHLKKPPAYAEAVLLWAEMFYAD